MKSKSPLCSEYELLIPIDHIHRIEVFNFFPFSRFAQLSKGIIVVGVFATHALQCYVAIDIAWTQYVHRRIEKSPRKLMWEYVLRTSIVFLTCKYRIIEPGNCFESMITSNTNIEFIFLVFPSNSYFSRGDTTFGFVHFARGRIMSSIFGHFIPSIFGYRSTMEHDIWLCESLHDI